MAAKQASLLAEYDMLQRLHRGDLAARAGSLAGEQPSRGVFGIVVCSVALYISVCFAPPPPLPRLLGTVN